MSASSAPGPAGLALALELDGAGIRVCVLESGGLGFDRALQRLSQLGEAPSVIKPAHFNRRRQVGGNAHLWRVGRRPQRSLIRHLQLDDIDFQQRPWVAHSGWPFGSAELGPYYARAHAMLHLGAPDYDLDSLVDGQAQPLPLGGGIRTSVERFGDAAPFLDYALVSEARNAQWDALGVAILIAVPANLNMLSGEINAQIAERYRQEDTIAR